MPSFPQPGSVTICDINRDFITAESLSDDRAKEAYGKILGLVFSPIPFRSGHLLPDLEQASDQQQDEHNGAAPTTRGFSALKESLYTSVKHLFFPDYSDHPPSAGIKPLNKHIVCKELAVN